MATAAAANIRVMIVDDHHIVRSSLRLMLEKHGCSVVAEADGAAEALTLAVRTRPHIVIMDLEMPGADGITATRRMQKVAPMPRWFFSRRTMTKKTSSKRLQPPEPVAICSNPTPPIS